MRQLSPDEATAELVRVVPILQEEAEHAMQRAVDLTFQRLTEYAPHGRTGELERDVTHTVRATKDGVTGRVRPRAPYAGYVDQGTGLGKTVRGTAGQAYSATTGGALSAGQELADPFGVMTATGYGSKTPGKKLAIHTPAGTIFRSRVRGQRARHFVQRTRDATADEVESILADGAQRASDRFGA